MSDAKRDGFINAAIPALRASLLVKDNMATDRHDQGADRTPDVVGWKGMLHHFTDLCSPIDLKG